MDEIGRFIGVKFGNDISILRFENFELSKTRLLPASIDQYDIFDSLGYVIAHETTAQSPTVFEYNGHQFTWDDDCYVLDEEVGEYEGSGMLCLRDGGSGSSFLTNSHGQVVKLEVDGETVYLNTQGEYDGFLPVTPQAPEALPEEELPALVVDSFVSFWYKGYVFMYDTKGSEVGYWAAPRTIPTY